MSKSRMYAIQKKLDIQATGDTEKQAVENTFKKMREKIGSEFEYPIIALRTIDYILNDIKKIETEEAYLYIFMKRKKISWEIDVTIKIEIEYVNFEGGK